MQKMNQENGQLGRSLYTAAAARGGGGGGAFEASNYSKYYIAAEETNEIGLAYLEEAPQTQNNTLLNSNYDFDTCNFNFVNLLNCSDLDSGSGNLVYEPVELQLNQTEGERIRQPKNLVTERQRRQTFNDKFVQLRSLLPNPNKNDRASIVGDAIEYIKELTRTVKELNILVDKKRCSKQRINKRYKPTTTASDEDNDIDTITDDRNEAQTTLLRSSWLQRKCKDTEIDVRIVHDDVTIKVVQRKKLFNLLLYVSRTFDELNLDLLHVTGGHVGDYSTFLFNTKMSQGSSLYAGAIANRRIHVLDRHHAAFHSI